MASGDHYTYNQIYTYTWDGTQFNYNSVSNTTGDLSDTTDDTPDTFTLDTAISGGQATFTTFIGHVFDPSLGVDIPVLSGGTPFSGLTVGDTVTAYANVPAEDVGDPGPSPVTVGSGDGQFLAEDANEMCFGSGTLIATPDGEIEVQNLAIGDDVLTADGNTISVKWIGRLTIMPLFRPKETRYPVTIRKGALGPALPHTDLVVTADHGICLDGIIVHAGALVNGLSIVRERPESFGERITYWHIETEEHEIILANGVPAETFIDNVSRQAFDNYPEFEDLFGPDVEEMRELPLPRAMSRRQVPHRLHEQLLAHATKNSHEIEKVRAA